MSCQLVSPRFQHCLWKESWWDSWHHLVCAQWYEHLLAVSMKVILQDHFGHCPSAWRQRRHPLEESKQRRLSAQPLQVPPYQCQRAALGSVDSQCHLLAVQ